MSFKVLLVYPNLQLVNLIPTNIGLLTSCLKSNGFEVKVFDTTFYKTKEKAEDEIRVEYGHYKSITKVQYKPNDVFEDFKKLYNEYKPDVIGVSVVDSTYELGLKLVSCIDKKCHVIFGGVYATFRPEIIDSPYIDSVCIGEGEEALVELCTKLKDKHDISNIPNLHVKINGTIYKNTIRPIIDLNKLPYEDFSEFEPARFLRAMQGKDRKMLPVMIDRGCPFNCIFCAEPSLRKLYNKFRVKSIDNIKQYLEYMVNTYNPEYLYFNSETFFARPEEHINEFADYYINNIKLPFCCMTRIETVTDSRIKRLKDMGCDRLSFGIEHGNESFRRNILKKTFTNDNVYDAINILNKYLIPCTFFNMVGFPDETKELSNDTIILNKWINNNYMGNKSFSISIFQPYYSTVLRQYCIDKGYMRNDQQAAGLISDCILNMPNFHRDDVIDIAKNFITLIS